MYNRFMDNPFLNNFIIALLLAAALFSGFANATNGYANYADTSNTNTAYLYVFVEYNNNEDNNIEKINYKIITDNEFYFQNYKRVLAEDIGEIEEYHKGEFAIELLSKNNVKKMERLPSEFAVEISNDITEFQIYYNGEKIFNKMISLCNYNNICEACFGEDCSTMENAAICSDCKSGENDNFCDLVFDQKCDNDCDGKDKDCEICNEEFCFSYMEETKCEEEYNGEICSFGKSCASEEFVIIGGLECCVESYCVTSIENNLINNQTKGDKYTDGKISKQDKEDKDDKNNQNNKEDNENNYFLYFLLLGLMIIIVIGLTIFFIIKIKKTKNIIVEVQRLKGQHNYQQIKEFLLKKGHKAEDIDLAIQQHYAYDNQRKI